MLQRLVNQRRQRSFRSRAWFPRLPDHRRENSSQAAVRFSLCCCKLADTAKSAIPVSDSLERISVYDLTKHCLLPVLLSRDPLRIDCSFVTAGTVKLLGWRANHSHCGVALSHATVEANILALETR